jgi:hypothetical protein
MKQRIITRSRAGYWKGENGSAILPELGVSGADILRGVIHTMHATWIGFHGDRDNHLSIGQVKIC